MSALRRLMPDIDFKTTDIPYDKLAALKVEWADFEGALAEVEPSALREVATEISDMRWDDVGGMDEVKRLLTEVVLWQLRYDDALSTGRRPRAQGRPSAWRAGHRQDASRQGARRRDRSQFHRGEGPAAAEHVDRRVRNGACARCFARRARPRPASSSSTRSMRWRRAAVAAEAVRSPSGWWRNCSPNSTASRTSRVWWCSPRPTGSTGWIRRCCVRAGWSFTSSCRRPTRRRGGRSCRSI